MPYMGGEETVRELRRALSSPQVQSEPLRYRNTVLKVIRVMSQGVDVAGLFSEMVKACATVDVVQKKLVYVFLCSYASLHPELSLLVINTLRKDCQDPNPMVRSLALRNMTSLRLPCLSEYVDTPLRAGLRDRAACVRRVAVLGWAKLHHARPAAAADIDAAVVNELYSMLRDGDPVVMVNCLRALEEVLKEEGGVAVNKAIAHHLLNRLKECDVWGQVEVLGVLRRYRPQTDEELFDILSLLDPSLLSPHPPVMAATLRLFLSLCCRRLPAVSLAALERAQGPLLAACGSASPEMKFTALCHVQMLLRSQPGLMGEHYKRFFCGYAEPAYIKQRKMMVLVELVNDDNVDFVLEELKGNCTDVNPDTGQAAITAIGRIGRSYSDRCLDILTSLLGLKQEHITSVVVQTMRDLVWACPQCSDSVCGALEACEDSLLQDSQGRQALLWLLGEHGDRVSSAPYLLEAFVDQVRSEMSTGVKKELLTSSMRVFLQRPAETQDTLGRLLHYCIEEETDMCVRDQASLYYRLLHAGIEETRAVLQGRRSDPSLGVLIGRPAEPVSQWAHSFNTLDPLRQCDAGTESPPQGAPNHAAFDLCHPLTHGQDREESAREIAAAQSISLLVPDPSAGPRGPCSEGPRLSLALAPVLSPQDFERLWLGGAQDARPRPGAQEEEEEQEQEEKEEQQEEKDEQGCVCRQERLQLSSSCLRWSPAALQAALRAVHIQTLAFSPPQSLPWRLFLYTHTHWESPPLGPPPRRDTPTLLLGELLYTGGPEGGGPEGGGPGGGGREEGGARLTLKQTPRDDEAAQGFLQVLSAALRSFSSECC